VRIVQMSDIHVGTGAFKPRLMEAAVEETNAYAPDLVAVVGDLTTKGYLEEFEEAKSYLDRLECPNVVVVPGNHDAHNVGHYHFEDLFGTRERETTFPVAGGEARVVALDSTEPDLEEGEVGREHYAWIDNEFRGWDGGPKVVVVHHHLLDIPGTGRDRNILRDAGDLMALLRELGVDLVLSGHRHVPYVWAVSGMLIVNSGTVSSTRVRGYMRPSYNRIEVGPEGVRVTMKHPGGDEEPLASGPWRPGSSVRLHPDPERYVRFDRLPVFEADELRGKGDL